MENDESGTGKSAMQLYPCPGLKVFCTLPDAPLRNHIEFNGRAFAVAGGTLFEVFADGTFKQLGQFTKDLSPCSMVAGANQVALVNLGIIYVFDLTTSAFTAASPASVPNASRIAYSDGFYLALIQNSNKFQISALLDATSWDPANAALTSVFPDNVVSMLVDHREPVMFGAKKTAIYYDSGNIFPFDVAPGGYVEQGTCAPNSPCRLDNSIFWIGGDERGQGIAWRANGYTPVRVSNHGVENAWQSYSTIADAESYAWQYKGHTFWQIYFPTANKTWVYDVAPGMWHERSSLDGSAHKSRCHMMAFGLHLVGDPNSGNIYQTSDQFLDDAGTQIHRVRRAPHISTEDEWIYFHELKLSLETGVGPQPPLYDGEGKRRDPQIFLRYSKDGGHTWSDYDPRGVGQAGRYGKRVRWTKKGRARDWVLEISCSDPVQWRIIDAYFRASPNFQPTERLATQLRKGA